MVFGGGGGTWDEKNIHFYGVEFQRVVIFFEKNLKKSFAVCEKSSIFATSIDEKKSCLKG